MKKVVSFVFHLIGIRCSSNQMNPLISCSLTTSRPFVVTQRPAAAIFLLVVGKEGENGGLSKAKECCLSWTQLDKHATQPLSQQTKFDVKIFV